MVVSLPPVWVGARCVRAAISNTSLLRDQEVFRLRIAKSAYRMDRKGTGYDFEIEPEPERAFEIMQITFTGS
jgi:hypothetical protein